MKTNFSFGIVVLLAAVALLSLIEHPIVIKEKREKTPIQPQIETNSVAPIKIDQEKKNSPKIEIGRLSGDAPPVEPTEQQLWQQAKERNNKILDLSTLPEQILVWTNTIRWYYTMQQRSAPAAMPAEQSGAAMETNVYLFALNHLNSFMRDEMGVRDYLVFKEWERVRLMTAFHAVTPTNITDYEEGLMVRKPTE